MEAQAEVGCGATAMAVPEVRHGRPRDPHVDAAIREAALDLLVEEGFARMSMEAVATRAGVGKAAIYRRWDSKTALVVDAIHALIGPKLLPFPETDDLRADLQAIFAMAVEKTRGLEGCVMNSVSGELAHNPDLARTVRAELIGTRMTELADRIRTSMAKGELAPGDPELLSEVGFAIIHHRALLGEGQVTDDLPRRLVEQFFPRPKGS